MTIITDFFNKVTINKYSENDLEEFYSSFLRLDPNVISNNLFKLIKHVPNITTNNNGYALYLFDKVFLNKIMEEIIMLDEKLKESSKKIAKSIGKAFYKDIGLMTKFAYATDKKTFEEALAESSFLMAKKSALTNENYYLNSDDLDILFEKIEDENFTEFKSYFVSFMSSSALYKNYAENKTNSEK